MNSNRTLSVAIGVILSGNAVVTPRIVHAAEPDSDSDAIQEITVTAQRRTQNMQDVPIRIRALTADALVHLNATTFDDFVL